MIYILSICLLPSLHRNLNFSMMANFLVWKVAILTLFVAVIKNAAASEEATSWKERAFGYVETHKEQFSALQGIGDSIRGNGYIESSELYPQFEKNLIACFFDNS